MTHAHGSHEIPTHLNVEDRLVFGLTTRQAVTVMAGLSGAYGVWSQWPEWPLALRLALVAWSVLSALLFALWQPGGRPLEEWAFAALRFATLPRASVWRPRQPDRAAWFGRERIWAEMVRPARLAWASPEDAAPAPELEARP